VGTSLRTRSYARSAGRRVTGPIAALILAVVTAALLAAACGGGSGSTATLGERAANDKVAVTVHSVKTYSKITTETGDVLTMKSPKNVYLIVDLTVRNLQDTALRIDPADVHLVTTDDHYWAGGGMLTAEFPDEFKALEARSVGPGKMVRGMVAYGVPKGTTLKSVTYVSDPDIAFALEGTTVSAPPVKRTPGVGQTVKGGGLAFTVTSMTYPSTLTNGVWTTYAKSGSKLVLLEVTVRNLERTPSYGVDPLSVALVDASGKRWGSFNRSALGLADSVQLPLKHLRPGAKASGKVVISVPKHVKIKAVRFEAGVLGPPLELRVTQ
jgi:hypothetical protein